MPTAIVIVGDLHINSAVALCPNEMERDNGQTILPSKSQQWLITKWRALWNTIREIKTQGYEIHVHVNGDSLDRNAHDPDGFELLDGNPATIIRWGLKVLEPARNLADELFVERGTKAHTGGAGYLEEQLAQGLSATKDPNTNLCSWWYFEGEAEGLRYVVAHHPGTNSARPWTQGGGANRRAAWLVADYYGMDWQPRLAVFNHVHHNEDSADNHPIRVIFNRGWTLKNAYDQRNGRGAQADVIGATLVLVNGEHFKVEKIAYPLKRALPWKKPN